MPTPSLFALLDDIASVLDDVAVLTKVATKKTAGVLGDDLALNAQQVAGVRAERELPVVWAVAKGSLVNKAILVPAALAISAFIPWAITPLLMVGGAFLCFEGAEKILAPLLGGHHAEEAATVTDPAELERTQVSGAIRTDMILSAEIMIIALNELPALSIWMQGIALAVVGIAITIGVYGVVALIVKMDDIGLALARRTSALAQTIGRGLVKAMPVVLKALALIGTAAMLWVGGQIILHGLEEFGFTTLPHLVHDTAHHVAEAVPGLGGVLEWIVNAAGAAVFGVLIGAVIAGVLHVLPKKH